MWGSSTARKPGRGLPLQFVVPAAPPAPPAARPPAPAAAPDDDDVWGEELPEDALEEAILLESQIQTAPPAAAAAAAAGSGARPRAELLPPDDDLWAEMELEEEDAAPAERLQELREQLRQLRQENSALGEEVRAAKAERYTHQGEASVLRAELAKRSREQETFRLESSRKLQEQQQQFQESTATLKKDLDAVKSELQFKSHELAEVSRQNRALRSPALAVSPPRKQARLSIGPPDPRRGFITSSEFRKPEVPQTPRETAATQTESTSPDGLDQDEPPPCHLVSAVLAAGGGADWLPAGALAALAELARLPRLCPAAAGRAARLLAEAAAARLAEYLRAAERLQTAADDDRRLCTLGSGRGRAAALLALLRHERASVAVLSALSRLAEWPGLAALLLRHGPLADLLPRLLRPVIVENEVRNLLMMEYTGALLAITASETIPENLLRCLEPAVSELLNTKPPGRVLRAVLELLAAAASTGQVSSFWCCHRAADRPSGTCLLKKLCILLTESAAGGEVSASHPLPASHGRRRPPPPSRPVDALRGELRPPELRQWTVTTPPAVNSTTDAQFVRLVALVASRKRALPSLGCCRGNLSLLVVHLLHRVVNEWEYGGGGDSSSAQLLLAALHRLSDLDPAFSASVSRARLHYLVTMETLGRRWRQMALSSEIVSVLQELYKFEPGTFDVAGENSPV